ncbi:hypothetical protein HDV05_007214 [Chytridiales sp. JEL 0842]|nr:hypothetical protein HDV05_007214 [Chytridiales sp. JEL 0842]
MEELGELVSRRITSLTYLRRLHDGSAHYMSTVLVSSDVLASLYDTKPGRKRSWQWFYLGMSIGALLVIADPLEFVKALNVLMLEYENETEAKQRLNRNLFNRKRSNSQEAVQANFLETGVYSYLQTPNLPFEVDYVHTFLALCDVLITAYAKFVDNTEDLISNPLFMESIGKVDSKVKKIIQTSFKDLEVLSKTLYSAELSTLPFLDPLLFIGLLGVKSGQILTKAMVTDPDLDPTLTDAATTAMQDQQPQPLKQIPPAPKQNEAVEMDVSADPKETIPVPSPAIQSQSPEKTDAKQPPSTEVQLVNGKVIYKEKKISLDRHPVTVSALNKFNTFRTNHKEALTKYPDEHLSLLALLIQDSDATLASLVSNVKSLLFSGMDEEEDNAPPILADNLISDAINQIATRINYGLKSDISSPAPLAIWRWEVKDKDLLLELKDRVDARVVKRQEVSEQLQRLYQQLPIEEQTKLFARKTRKPRNSAAASIAAPKVAPALPATPTDDNPQAANEPAPAAPPIASKNAPAVEKEKPAEKEKKAKKPKESGKKKKEEEKAKSDRSQSNISSFFTRIVKKDTAAQLKEDATLAAFLERFLPFHVKKSVILAPRNRFYHTIDKATYDQNVTKGGDPTQLRDESYASFRKSGKERFWVAKRPKPVLDPISRLESAKWKLLHFHEDYRPAYYGTWTKLSSTINGRKPFGKDAVHLNYEVDSEAEWEEDEPGEELKSDDEEDEEGENLGGGDADDDEDGWLVPDGYLSDDEVNDAVTGDAKEMAKKVPQEQDQKSKPKAAPLIPVILGPFTSMESLEQYGAALEGFFVQWTQNEMDIDPFEKVSAAAPTAISLVTDTPGTTKSGKTKHIFDESQINQLISVVQGSGALAVVKLVDKLKEIFPNLSRAYLEGKLREVAIKEKREGDEKAKWHIRTTEFGNDTESQIPLKRKNAV